MTAQRLVFSGTPDGQLLYDLVFVNLTDKWIARKHAIPLSEVRKLRKLPRLLKLRKKAKSETP